jgi:hypothetical protein
MNQVITFPPASIPRNLEWNATRRADIKRSFATRRVPLEQVASLDADTRPRAGDVVLARVTRVGQHGGLQLPDGRRATLFAGDEIIVAFGNRYAPDQFEAIIPDDLGPCALAAGGGIAGRVVASHGRMRAPTQIEPIGLLRDANGRTLNLADHALPTVAVPEELPPVIVVAGTSMNAGKTTAASQLVHGLARAGLRVGAGKLTGTAACGDTMLMRDAGARFVLDFTDFGMATTYLAPIETLERTAEQVIAHLASELVDVIVVEIADGLYQPETAALLRAPRLRRLIGGLLFASPDSMGAVGGVDWLRRQELAPLGLVGAMTASPLSIREAEAATRLPVYPSGALADPQTASELLLAASVRAGLGAVGNGTRRSA